MKSLKLLWATLLLAALPFLTCRAETIDFIRVEVHLQPDGSAVVWQRWVVTPDSGSEMYIPMENLGKMYVDGFYLWEGDSMYENDGRNWDSSRSRLQKAGRCGIIDKGSGVELCWGKGELDVKHDWTMRYNLHGLVQSYKDYDGFYFMFIADELSYPEKARVVIYPPEGVTFSDDNIAYWGFGYEGDIYLVEDGTVVADAPNGLGWENPMLVMMRFEKGLMSPEISVDKSFDSLSKKAFKGSDYSSSDEGLWLFVLIALCFAFIVLFVIFYVIRHFLGFKYMKSVYGTRKISGWWRDVPFPECFEASYHIYKEGQDLLSRSPEIDICGAYFLRWVMNGYVKPQPANKKDRVNLVFPEAVPEGIDGPERRLFEMALAAAGDNRILEQGEFDKWAERHYTQVVGFPGSVGRTGLDWLRKTGYYSGKVLSPESQEKFRHVVEFRNFLSDFTLSGERGTADVSLWKDYLIYAQLFGIADKVAKQFKKLYPEGFAQFAQNHGMNDVLFMNTINYSRLVTAHAYSNALSRKIAAEQRQRSSGHGGSSSIGFGGGFSGGGHGGSR